MTQQVKSICTTVMSNNKCVGMLGLACDGHVAMHYAVNLHA